MTEQNKKERTNYGFTKIDGVTVNLALGRAYPSMSHFPIEKFNEWDKDCKSNWAGIRWAKAYHDHQIAKSASKEEAMWSMIMELRTRLDNIEQSPVEEQKPEEVKTLGKKKVKKDG